VQVRCDEGVATHIGLEPCVDAREGAGEASAGEYTGQPLSRDRKIVPGADDVTWCGRQYGWVRNRGHPIGPARSETLACVDAPCAGTGRSRDRPVRRAALARVGKARSRSR
jgi:hypothetical protein